MMPSHVNAKAFWHCNLPGREHFVNSELKMLSPPIASSCIRSNTSGQSEHVFAFALKSSEHYNLEQVWDKHVIAQGRV